MEENLQLHTSNRLEHLLEAWVRRLRRDPLPPFAREVVVVQSQGMRRWLLLEMARRRGIAAGLWMPFPRDLARCLSEAVLDGHLDYESQGNEPGPFDREILVWRLFGLLGQLNPIKESSLRIPAAYLAADPDQRKRFQLASRLAALFDDYQLFRGDWLRSFEAGLPIFEEGDAKEEIARWQAHLWRQLQEEERGDHLARRLAETLERLRQPRLELKLPPRITVFGVSSLPPIFLQLLRAASRHLPVEIYFASPTWHYWGDLFSDREQLRLARRFRRRHTEGTREQTEKPAHLERGNSLLSGLGQQGRDFFNLLQELDDSGDTWHEVDFEEPGQTSVLRAVQSDILNLVDRGSDEPPLPLALGGDGSLAIHVCHSPLREMEVLREELLRAFLEMPQLRPSDILVLLPDIETYAPLIDAVFGVAHEGAPSIPYSIADRRLASTQKPAAALLALLDLVGLRLTVAEVFGLLESPALRRAAGIEESELGLLRARVQQVGIRWAIDGRQRSEEFGVPSFEESSWQAGIDRLLLGYAIGPTDSICCGIAPSAGDGAGNTDLLGRFLAFLDRLFGDLRALQKSRHAIDWSRDLLALTDRQLLADGEDEEIALQLLRDAFARLDQAQALAGLQEDLPLEVIRQYLRHVLADDQASGGFLSGGITFCALRPMRSIPFELVAIAGLDDASFPRRDPPRAFDLLALAPQRGDRSPRLDDRYLFLETLLAARERLLLFYPGASQRDSAEKAPSVVLSELLDLLDRSFEMPDGSKARRHLLVHHPLQAWSATNFGPQPRSSSRENAAACAALRAPRQDLPPFLPSSLALPAAEDEEKLELRLEELIEAYTSPSRYFCRHVLGLSLAEDDEEEEEKEVFALATLPRFRLMQEMLEKRLGYEEADAESELALLRARFDLPPALLGEATYRRLLLEVETLLGRLEPGMRAKESRLAIEVVGNESNNYVLRGSLAYRGENLLRLRPAALRPRDLLGTYIEGLAAQAQEPGKLRTIAFGKEGGFELRPGGRAGRAKEQLGDLVAGFRELSRQAIPFFEKASFAYAEEQQRLLDPRKARPAGAELAAARQGYSGDERRRGDRNALVDLLWRGQDPLELPAFAEWAKRVYRPVLENRKELKV